VNQITPYTPKTDLELGDRDGFTLANLPFEKYLAVKAMNHSSLHRGRESMLDLHYQLTAPPTPPTPTMIRGSAFGILVLEPEREKDIAVRPTFAGKGSVAAREAWDEAHQGALIITQDTYDDIRHMRDAVLAHRVAGPLLRAQGHSEVSCFWKDPKTGLGCKARIDRVCTAGQCLIDLKSSASPKADAFARSIYDYGYYIQDPFYREGWETCTGQAWPMLFVVCKNEAPWNVVVYRIGPESRGIGANLIHELMEKYVACVEAKLFPSYADDEVMDIEMPLWALKRWTEAQGDDL